MGGAMEKSLAILEHLATCPEGATLAEIASKLNQVPSGCHSALGELIQLGYVRQLPQHRERRFSIIENTYALGISALAAPIQHTGMPAMGAVVIAGPSSRFTLERMQEFGPALLAAADELAAIGDASPLLKSSNIGP